MKKKMLLFSILSFFSLSLIGCSTAPVEPTPTEKGVKSVTLDKTSLDMYVFQLETLTATVDSYDGLTYTVTWASSDTSVVTVNNKGTVLANKVGEATITAQAADKSATCKIKVIEDADQYTVTFNSNGGTPVTSQTVIEGNKVKEPIPPTKEGYNFKGWYLDSSFTQKFDFSTIIDSDITLYAKWAEDSEYDPETDPNNRRYNDAYAKKHVEEVNHDYGDDFILGMDASCVPSLENSGVTYYNFDGNEADVYEILSDNGINYIRVRIWNDPFNASGKGYGGGNCDINNAIAIGKRASKYGMKLLVDFHYSDFWADPLKQKAPKAWENYTVAQKAEAIYEFTKDCLQKLKTNNVDVGMVQVGNETNQGKVCGCTGWDNFATLMGKGSKAVREVYPSALVAVHFTNPEKNGYSVNFASYCNQKGLDYDVFGTSYYPYWHGTLDNLSNVLSTVATKYNKKVMVMETSYCYRSDDTDFYSNTSPKSSDVQPHEISVQGQYDQITDVIKTIKNNTTNGIGVCYWEGTWISVGTTSWNQNHQLWEQYGSGWASSYAAEYDPDDAGQYYGGCGVDNQAFFSEKGNVLHSLKAFNRKVGEEVEPTPEPTESYNLTVNLTLTTAPTNNVALLYDINRSISSDWINNDATWNTMSKNNNTYSYTIENLKQGDVVRFCFVTWIEAGNLFLDGSDDWKPASYTMANEDHTLSCTATSFSSSIDTVAVFTVN